MIFIGPFYFSGGGLALSKPLSAAAAGVKGLMDFPEFFVG